MSGQLSWPRLRALLRNESIGEYRNWLTASVVSAAVLLIGAMIAVNRGGSDGPYYGVVFFALLVIWGTIHSSLAFSELHDKSKNTAFLLLPASALEKTLAPLLTTTVVLIVYLLAFTTVASLAIEGVNWLVYRRTNALFNPLDPDVWAGMPRYLVVQSWFFLGAAWFRRAHYLKTLFALAVGGFALAGLGLVLSWVAGVTAFTPNGLQVQADFRHWVFMSDSPLNDALRVSLAIAWFIVLPVFCWWLTWLRVAETQVSHGV